MPYSPDDKAPQHLTLDDLKPGFEATLSHTVTQADLDAFAALTGDYNPVHMDAEFARQQGFGKPVVHGMLTSSFISTMVGMLLPGRGALWTSQTLKFTRPCFVGDTITVTSKVTHVSAATRSITCEVAITNQTGVTLVAGESQVRLMDESGLASVQGLREAPSESTSTSDAAPTIAPAGQAVLVTGGSRGIGAAVAKRLAADGHDIAVNYLNAEDRANDVVAAVEANGRKAIAVAGDVGDPATARAVVEAAAEAVGPLGGLVHCAAPTPQPTPFADTDAGAFAEQFRVQVGGAVNLVQALLPGMVAASSGSVVLVGSIFAEGTPPANQAAYVAAKAALHGLARALAVEVGPKGLRVNVVAPGMTQTEMLADLPEKAKMLAKMNTPLRRLAEPEDVADAVGYLMSGGARHVTGTTLHVSGGL